MRLPHVHRHPRHIPDDRTLGQRMADHAVAIIGSWPFICSQSIIMAAWMLWNGLLAYRLSHGQPFDPYPWILLNLALSTQAGIAGPLILLSGNRQAEIDRQHAEASYGHTEEILTLQRRQMDLLAELATKEEMS